MIKGPKRDRKGSAFKTLLLLLSVIQDCLLGIWSHTLLCTDAYISHEIFVRAVAANLRDQVRLASPVLKIVSKEARPALDSTYT